MKRLLIVIVIILMIDQVLTPFSYVFSNEDEIFDMQENVVIENEVETESSEDIQDSTLENQNEEENTEDTTYDSTSSDNEIEENNQTEITDEETWEEENNLHIWDDNELNDGNTTWDETEENNTSESSTIVILLAEKLWINWEEDAKYYAELAWIDKSEYEWTREQNERIRLFLIEHEQEVTDGEFDEIIEQKKTEDEETPDYSEYTKETRVAVLAEKLGIEWEEDAKYYAELVWIERWEYEWTREQNEQIRLFFLDNLEEILNGEYEETISEMKTENQEWLTWDEAEFEIEVETWSSLTWEIITENILTGEVITWDIELVMTWCSDDYHEENGLCEPNTKTVDCEQKWWVENSAYIETWVTVTWDIIWWVRNETPVCEWECLDNYHEENGLCESNTKTVKCEKKWWVDNSTYIVTWVTITRDTVWWIRNETPACKWECKPHYHESENGCKIDNFMFTSVENPNVHTLWSIESWKKPYDSKIELEAYVDTWYRFLWWKIIGLNWTGISNTSVSSQIVFNMPDRDVTATPLSEVIEYKIVYRNVDDAVMDNPDTYTIETPTFSLKEPTKTWYTFLWWTGSNGLNPEKEITLTKWNYGNKKYTAVWQPNSWIEYQVVHATEKANSTSYEVRETEILTGTTDELTQAIAKSYTWFTAKEITQKTIKWDGSTAVRVQYQRNIYTISFDSNGWSEVSPITWKYESDLIAPSDPIKSGYIFTGWKPDFPSTMPLSWAELVAQWKQELEVNDIDEELEIARKTLNKKKIKWKETYNNITVNVEAPKNSFPEWVELRISPITWDTENQSIKNQLMKNTDVTEDSELVSFDISFIYTLSNGEEVELQPKDWNIVKVWFNYKNNNKFNKGKKEKNKDLKIYHFEKVKNKKGKKSEETQIKEIKINESESTESEIVIDADSFSVYSVALVNWAWEEQDNFDVPMLKAISLKSVAPEWNLDDTKTPINLQFDARGWEFTNGSSAKSVEYRYYTRTETKYAHTSNYDDDWTSNWNCSSSDEKTIPVEIVWATNLDIEVIYWLGSSWVWSDSLRIVADWINRTFSNSSSWKGSTSWNSVSFTLNLAFRILSWYPKWYYATIVWTIPVWWRTQDDIEEPNREWYKFDGWYTDTTYTTGFNEENYNFENGSRIIYAKWTCASWYTEVWWECKQDCSVPASLWWGTIHHGQSVTWYQSVSVPYGQTCQSETRTCNNGTLGWSYLYLSCQTEQPTWCTLPWWWTTWHGAILTAYTTSSATCPTTCTSATATCNNGVWSVNNFTWTYTNQTCTINSSTCDASFTLNSTGVNWIYSGCTSYTVNGNSCSVWTTKYKLTNCANGYHTENNSTCVNNSKQVACAQNGKPANSSYVAWNVTVNWQWTWNSGNWSATGNCAWICDPHYHTWANNNSCEIDQYTVTIWVIPSGYGTVSNDSVTKNYGSTITENGNKVTIWWTEITATPTSASQEFTYTFSWWNNTCGGTLTKDCTITAQFERTTNKYLITFKNRDGTTLQTWMVEYGTIPIYNWETPTKASTQQFTYTFTWWSPTIIWVTETTTYTAIYNTTTNQYTATIWVSPSGYGSVNSGSVKKNYGAPITINEDKITIWWTEVTATPTSASQEFTYTFSWWNNTCGGNLTANCTITAEFKKITNQYTITFYDEDGTTELWSSTVNYWTDATYGWTTPTKAATQQYTYEFDDWYTSPEWWSVDDLSDVTADRNVYARYSFVVNPYTVTIWVSPSEYGTVSSDSVTKNYGSTITENRNKITIWWMEVTATPTSDTSEWDYEFVNWTNNCNDTLTDNCTITANFTRMKKSYLITFKNWDGEILQTWMVEYGTRPEYNWVTPRKAADAQYTYTFAWWSPIISSVTQIQEYTAQFSDTINKYNVTFDSNGWTPTPSAQSIAYWSKATKPEDPIRTGYAFGGWTLNGNDFDFNTEIIWTINLVAEWNLVDYTITYNLNWWTETVANPTSYTVESWAITLHQPTRVWYTFLWWTGSNWSAPQTWVTIPAWSYGDKTYNAVWTADSNTQYIVYHYVKRVWQNTYELSDTETKYWTTDETLTISSLAKENVFTCAHYDRWSLTWTESWPWEIVTQTTIRWDGTMKIYLFYVRDYYNVYLTGDEHVDILKINGVETEHAVLECGSEVPVGAVPKPWYHFVRRDKEERERRLEEGEEDSSWE